MTEGPGERAERLRARRYWAVSLVFGLMGAGVGATLAYLGDNDARSLSAGWAVGVTLLYVICLPLGTWLFLRQTDEVDLRDNLIACTAGIYFYTAVYPGWYFLWKGGLVPEPDHQLLFIGTMSVVAVIYFWKRLRP
ncbi:MAG TPA: hypothetical protein VN029_08205 [Sphingomonas sp.]|nr:hypothetical protein [Sphingomonas sp.]